MSAKFILTLAISFASLFGISADPPNVKPPIDLPIITKKKPVEKPVEVKEEVDSSFSLKQQQWFIIGNESPLIIQQVSLGGSVTITESKKTSITVPASWAIGRDPDADDPDSCTVTAKKIYIVKAKTTGKVILLVNPTLNQIATDGKTLIPFTEKDYVQIPIDVFAGEGPQPPPKKPVDDPVIPVPDKPIAKASSLLVITLEETFVRSPAVGKEMEDQFWKDLAGRGHAFRHFEANDDLVVKKNYLKLMTDKEGKTLPLPAVLILNRNTGEKLSSFPFTTASAVDAETRKVSDR